MRFRRYAVTPRYGLGMTTTNLVGTDATTPLRNAGKLFVVAGIGSVASALLAQGAFSIPTPPDVYVYGPSILLALAAGATGLVAGFSIAIAFVLLFVWLPGRRQLVFFGPAIGGFLGLASFVLDGTALLVLGVFLSLLAILSGLVVYQQRFFLTRGSLVFVVTMVVSLVPALASFVDPPGLGLELVLRGVVGACYVFCGFEMIHGARSRAGLIDEGSIAR